HFWVTCPLHKSFIFPVNQVNNLELLAENLGCQITSLPTKYLGMPLGAKNKKLEIWSELLEKCVKKLAKWKSQYLSLGGRLTLIKSVMDAHPIYMMSLFPIPKSIEKKINRLRVLPMARKQREERLLSGQVGFTDLTEIKGSWALKISVYRMNTYCKSGFGGFCTDGMVLWRSHSYATGGGKIAKAIQNYGLWPWRLIWKVKIPLKVSCLLGW
ncbi:hypothetical protein MTR67_035335, partial [Solanum verrucosum]